MVCSASSAAQKARAPGSQSSASAGASESGASSATSSTPSSTTRWPVSRSSSVGAISPGVPAERALPMPASTCPPGPRGSSPPNMWVARRAMALPATRVSSTTASAKPTGATTRTRPAATSASSTMPRTPP